MQTTPFFGVKKGIRRDAVDGGISYRIGPEFGTDPMGFVSVNRKAREKKGRFVR